MKKGGGVAIMYISKYTDKSLDTLKIESLTKLRMIQKNLLKTRYNGR